MLMHTAGAGAGALGGSPADDTTAEAPEPRDQKAKAPATHDESSSPPTAGESHSWQLQANQSY